MLLPCFLCFFRPSWWNDCGSNIHRQSKQLWSLPHHSGCGWYLPVRVWQPQLAVCVYVRVKILYIPLLLHHNGPQWMLIRPNIGMRMCGLWPISSVGKSTVNEVGWGIPLSDYPAIPSGISTVRPPEHPAEVRDACLCASGSEAPGAFHEASGFASSLAMWSENWWIHRYQTTRHEFRAIICPFLNIGVAEGLCLEASAHLVARHLPLLIAFFSFFRRSLEMQ